MIHDTVTLLSLMLTPATIISCLAVTVLWFDSAKKAFYERHKTEMHWLILGVFFSFIGSMVDNTYWGLAWSASYLDDPAKEALFHNGVYSNLPFRQITTLVAAYCHVRAAVATQSLFLKWMLAIGWTLSITFTIALYAGS